MQQIGVVDAEKDATESNVKEVSSYCDFDLQIIIVKLNFFEATCVNDVIVNESFLTCTVRPSTSWYIHVLHVLHIRNLLYHHATVVVAIGIRKQWMREWEHYEQIIRPRALKHFEHEPVHG